MKASKVFDYDANLVVNLSGPSTEAKQQQIFYIKQNGKHVFETQNKRKTSFDQMQRDHPGHTERASRKKSKDDVL